MFEFVVSEITSSWISRATIDTKPPSFTILFVFQTKWALSCRVSTVFGSQKMLEDMLPAYVVLQWKWQWWWQWWCNSWTKDFDTIWIQVRKPVLLHGLWCTKKIPVVILRASVRKDRLLNSADSDQHWHTMQISRGAQSILVLILFFRVCLQDLTT